MKCYLFDEHNLFSGEYDAQESPLEPGVYIFPEKSTTIQPPVLQANEFAVFNGSAWEIKTNPELPNPTIDEIRELKTAEIDSAYNAAITANIDYLNHTFQADFPTHDNIKSVLSCGVVPDGFAWFDINNTPVAMTYAQLQGFSQALVLRGFAAFVKKQDLKAQIRAAVSVADVAAVVW